MQKALIIATALALCSACGSSSKDSGGGGNAKAPRRSWLGGAARPGNPTNPVNNNGNRPANVNGTQNFAGTNPTRWQAGWNQELFNVGVNECVKEAMTEAPGMQDAVTRACTCIVDAMASRWRPEQFEGLSDDDFNSLQADGTLQGCMQGAGMPAPEG